MSNASRANGWMSRLVVVLQLVTWSAVSIVLLQKGVSSLYGRTLKTSNHVIEVDPLIGDLRIESTASTTKHTETEHVVVPIKEQSISKSAKIIIRTDPESSLRDHSSSSGTNMIKGASRDALEIVSEEHRRSTQSPSSGKISRVTERVLERSGASENVLRAKEESAISEPVSKEQEEEYPDTVGKNFKFRKDFIEDASSTAHDSFWRSKTKVRFSHRAMQSAGGTAMAVAMVTIGSVMLLLGSAVVILRLLDERRRRARKSRSELSATVVLEEDSSLPTYEQAVLMSETPRLSALVSTMGDRIDNIERPSSPSSPPPSPTPSLPAYSSILVRP